MWVVLAEVVVGVEGVEGVGAWEFFFKVALDKAINRRFLFHPLVERGQGS